MPAPLTMNEEHDDLHDIDALDIQPPDIDHRSPMERQATGAPRHEHSRGRGHGGHRRKRQDHDRQPRVDTFAEDGEVAPRFVKHETPMPSPIVAMMDEPEIVVHHEAPVVEVAPAPVAKAAPRAPRERKVPKINSPLMQETTLMDVTAMNAAAAQATSDTQPVIQSDAPADEAGNLGEIEQRPQERKFSRRRANHLRPYHRNKGENATTDNK
jgi:hypothetical protein